AYNDLQELQAQECSVIPIWQGKDYVVSNTDISGVYLDITSSLRYWLLDITGTTPTTTTTTSSTTTTTNTTGTGMPIEVITLIISISSAGVIIIIVIVIINSRKK
ncbi:MAG: hypothetical protein IH631_06230, partial [Candidatus Thorarchaeota archaeon]|nr:hypothetical protein [Candidatus Thorarchaeota archaeon]